MELFPNDLIVKATTLLASCRAEKLRIALAESCTGGLVCAVLTEIPGSSEVVDCGLVAYSILTKTKILGISNELLRTYGPVSEPVARAMVEGILGLCPAATLAIAVTGFASPVAVEKSYKPAFCLPAGLVHLAGARRGIITLHRSEHFSGNRSQVRLSAVTASLSMLEKLVFLNRLEAERSLVQE